MSTRIFQWMRRLGVSSQEIIFQRRHCSKYICLASVHADLWLSDYLTAYAERFGVLERTRLNCRVASVSRGEKGGWSIQTSGEKPSTISTKKLVIATGLTSEAFLPKFEGQDSFGLPVFHSKDFLQHAETLSTTKRMVVLGGTKSAWDAVYTYATAGVAVDWVIRGMFSNLSSFCKSSFL